LEELPPLWLKFERVLVGVLLPALDVEERLRRDVLGVVVPLEGVLFRGVLLCTDRFDADHVNVVFYYCISSVLLDRGHFVLKILLVFASHPQLAP